MTVTAVVSGLAAFPFINELLTSYKDPSIPTFAHPSAQNEITGVFGLVLNASNLGFATTLFTLPIAARNSVESTNIQHTNRRYPSWGDPLSEEVL